MSNLATVMTNAGGVLGALVISSTNYVYAADAPAAPAAAAPGAAVPAVAAPVDPTFGYLLIAVVAVVVVLACMVVAIRLSRPPAPVGGVAQRPWSLPDALSEEVDFTLTTGAKETRMVASSSRLIALLGLIVLLTLFLGIGLSVIVKLCTDKTIGDLSGVEKYLLTGLAMFVPYGFNQVKSAFDSLGK